MLAALIAFIAAFIAVVSGVVAAYFALAPVTSFPRATISMRATR